jgi:drug/metabolite transporter (DMT)-like permease
VANSNSSTAEAKHANGSAATLPLTGLLLLAGLSFVWGVNWPIMKIAVSEIPVWWFRSACLIFGGVGLMSIAVLSGAKIVPRQRDVLPMIATSIYAVMGWHVCAGFGVSLMESGRAVIIAFTMPVWASLFAAWLLGERISKTTIAGLALGLLGLAALIGPDLAVFGSAPLGAILMLGSAMSWGLGTVLFKRFAWSIPVVSNMAWQLLLAAIPVTLIAAATSPLPDPASVSPAAWWSLAYVLLLPMTFGQWAYFQIVGMFPASIAALGTLAIPVVGVVSGAIILNETVGPREISALALICAALTMILLVPHLMRARSKRR